MISLPILAGALMRFPLGILALYIGRKNAAITEMTVIMMAMAYGFLRGLVYNDVLAMGVLLASPGPPSGVALSLGSAGSAGAQGAGEWASRAPAIPAPCWLCCSPRRWRRPMAGRPPTLAGVW